MTEHVILVAMVVEAPSRLEAEAELHRVMNLDRLRSPHRPVVGMDDDGMDIYGDTYVDSWWVAEDDRRDGSDNDSAVFCGPGYQRQARQSIVWARLAYERPGWKATTYRLPD